MLSSKGFNYLPAAPGRSSGLTTGTMIRRNQESPSVVSVLLQSNQDLREAAVRDDKKFEALVEMTKEADKKFEALVEMTKEAAVRDDKKFDILNNTNKALINTNKALMETIKEILDTNKALMETNKALVETIKEEREAAMRSVPRSSNKRARHI